MTRSVIACDAGGALDLGGGSVAPVPRPAAHLKTWKILFTDYRRPLNTFLDSFRAAIGLYFFELSFQ